MKSFQSVLTDYKRAWRYRSAFVAIYVFVLVLMAAIVVPVIGLTLNAVLSVSGQSALTDQDIAGFLLTPFGFVGGLAVASLLVTASVLGVTMMAVALVSQRHDAAPAIRQSIGFVLLRAPMILWFSAALVLRILVIILPLAAVGGAVAYYLLGQYDINYYLSVHPPEFLIAAGVGAVLTAVIAAFLLSRLAAWSIALPLILIDDVPVGASFAKSSELMSGHKVAAVLQILIWTVARNLVLFVVAALFGWVISEAADLIGARLRVVAILSVLLLGLWSVVNAGASALCNGALSNLIIRFYTEATQKEIEPLPQSKGQRRISLSPAWLVAGAAVLILAGFVMGGRVLDDISSDHSVEIIAHRGAAAARPENTMAAVKKAIEDRADWVEIDVQETADDRVVVAHDSDFMKTSSVPLKVWDATLADLQDIDIGSWFDPVYSDQRPPLLSDVLNTAKGKIKVLIELKYYGHDIDLENRVANLVEAAGMDTDIAIMSLKYDAVLKMQSIRPGWRTGILAARAVGNIAGLRGDFVAINSGQANLSFIKTAHNSGKDVYVWTVNDPVTMSRMISMGVDGLITDEPALARSVLDQRDELSNGEKFLLWLVDRFDVGTYELIANPDDA